jgi:hypothetical protein
MGIYPAKYKAKENTSKHNPEKNKSKQSTKNN